MKTQGTEMFYIDPDDGEVVPVGCVTQIDGIDVTVEQNEVTCLADLVRRYEAGLGTPGQASFAIYTDPSDASHLRLHELKRDGVTLQWAVGWSDGTGIEPESTTDTDGDFIVDPPDTRSWLLFEGFMANFPFSFQQNASVQSNISIQISGEPTWIAKTAT